MDHETPPLSDAPDAPESSGPSSVPPADWVVNVIRPTPSTNWAVDVIRPTPSPSSASIAPPRPPPRRSLWQRFQQASRGARIGITIGALVASCALCSCVAGGVLVVLGSVPPPLAATSSVSAPTAAKTAATPTLQTTRATATPHAAIVTGATFGGPDSAFQAKYGNAADDLWDINGVTFSTNLDVGVDGQQHVFGMLVYKSDATTWTQAEAQPICTAFLPPEAIHTRDTRDDKGNLEQVYTSARLVATFAPSSPWYDPTGTVTIRYEIANGGVFQCGLDPYVL